MKILLDTHTFLWFIAGDALMIAQAIQEGMALITKDQAFDEYNVQVAWSLP